MRWEVGKLRDDVDERIFWSRTEMLSSMQAATLKANTLSSGEMFLVGVNHIKKLLINCVEIYNR